VLPTTASTAVPAAALLTTSSPPMHRLSLSVVQLILHCHCQQCTCRQYTCIYQFDLQQTAVPAALVLGPDSHSMMHVVVCYTPRFHTVAVSAQLCFPCTCTAHPTAGPLILTLAGPASSSSRHPSFTTPTCTLAKLCDACQCGVFGRTGLRS
jgi:hypothetical protein